MVNARIETDGCQADAHGPQDGVVAGHVAGKVAQSVAQYQQVTRSCEASNQIADVGVDIVECVHH